MVMSSRLGAGGFAPGACLLHAMIYDAFAPDACHKRVGISRDVHSFGRHVVHGVAQLLPI
jgi:hypothetical protein